MADIKVKRVTLSDVAKLAGVSRGAAGKVINGCDGNISVSDNTCRRVREAARILNYRNNMAAAMLAGRSSSLIGVMTDTQTHFRSRQLLQEIEKSTSRHNFRLLVGFTHDNMKSMRDNYEAMHSYGVCGIICLAHDYPQFCEETAELFRDSSDVVFMGQPHFETGAWVNMDVQEALTELIAELKRDGRQRIGLVHSNLFFLHQSRLLESYRGALEANNIPFRPELLGCLSDTSSTLERCMVLIRDFIEKERPDAIFIDDAQFAVCIQSHLQSSGWRIPEELVICGGNNDPLFTYVTPAIRSLNPHFELVAEEFVRIIRENKFHENKTIHATYR
jgi:LacI family transcriptional regulator